MNVHGSFFFVGALVAVVLFLLGVPPLLSFLFGLVAWTWMVFGWIMWEHRRIRRLYQKAAQHDELEERRRKAWLS